ncbi:MAG TPA: hypothetical protein VHN82_00600 [Methanoregula sp.]|nr:hypothetical protein [Methanoregula sp.]
MYRRLFTTCTLLLLILLMSTAGCSSSPVNDTGKTVTVTTIAPEKPGSAGEVKVSSSPSVSHAPNITEQLASIQSDNPVWREAYRMFRNIRSTEYVHPPYTDDDAAGIYRFDCLGFVDHVLMNSAPDSYKAIGKGVNPSIESYSAYFAKLDVSVPNSLGWIKVARPADLKPGDVCLWLKPSTLDTGHMWIIAGMPSVNPKRDNELLVRIFDSTGTAHGDDSRTIATDKTGLGSGIIGFMTDGQGDPIGLYWEGAASTGSGEKDTTIICGRLNK